MGHTPGPWRFFENIVVTDCNNLKTNRTHGYGCGNNFIARLNDGEYHEYSSAAEQAANGHLIAAAPDLLDALRDMVSDRNELNEGTIAFARWAIAKAEGRS